MTMKDSFSAEEWVTLQRAPLSAALAIAMADPGGLLGAVKEGGALASAMRDAAKGSPGLVQDLIGDLKDHKLKPSDLGITRPKSREEGTASAVAAVKAAADLADAKAPEHAAGFKAWLLELSKRVAEASKEGGFLGIGGERVSDAEEQMLAAIAAAVGQ